MRKRTSEPHKQNHRHRGTKQRVRDDLGCGQEVLWTLDMVKKSSGHSGFCSSFGHGLERMQNLCKVEEHAAMPAKVFSLIFFFSQLSVLGLQISWFWSLGFMGLSFSKPKTKKKKLHLFLKVGTQKCDPRELKKLIDSSGDSSNSAQQTTVILSMDEHAQAWQKHRIVQFYELGRDSDFWLPWLRLLTNWKHTSYHTIIVSNTTWLYMIILKICRIWYTKTRILWWEAMSWVNRVGPLPIEPKNHFLQFSHWNAQRSTDKRWEALWIALSMTIWKHRNNMVFNNQLFIPEKVMDETLFHTWSWLRCMEKDFNAYFNHWSSNLREEFS